ncbi:cation:proton antiporter subunit C [Haloparvum sedimenti]|uniref:cation:proton antiporter subunit C n=1 Tax=Haloparvum sedimenti TaxID=1678448 RepID=UPI00071E7338|nr:cation:proton antiporter subunit C [Haloparvum sedimenti]
MSTQPLLIDVLATRTAYAAFVALLCTGIYMMIANEHLVKKIIGLNLFQTAIFLFYIASAYVDGGAIPILSSGEAAEGLYVSPLPHVIVLTAIVVGVSLTAVALALCIRIYDEYGTLNVNALRDVMREEGTLPTGETERLRGARDADTDGQASNPSAGTGSTDAAGGPEGGETA